MAPERPLGKTGNRHAPHIILAVTASPSGYRRRSRSTPAAPNENNPLSAISGSGLPVLGKVAGRCDRLRGRLRGVFCAITARSCAAAASARAVVASARAAWRQPAPSGLSARSSGVGLRGTGVSPRGIGVGLRGIGVSLRGTRSRLL